MAKKLKNVLRELKKKGFEGNIYVGGENGSAFFYIGNIDEKAKMQEAFDKADVAIRQTYETNFKTLNHYLSLDTTNWGLNEKLDHVDDLYRMRGRILKAQEYINHYKSDIMDNEVKAVYSKTDPQEHGKIIIMNHGMQIGKLWSIDDVK